MEGTERRGRRETSVAVAVNKDKTSLHALQWAIDNIVARDQILKILHVKDSVSTSLPPPGPNDDMLMDTDKHTADLFLPFLCFCKRKQVEGEAVMLDDSDVAKAIVEYVFRHRVEILLLGAGSRNGLSRLFRAADIAGSILKLAPAFCTVYVISKRRICGMRKAKLLVSDISSHGGAMRAHRNSTVEEASSAESIRWYDEVAAADMDFQFDGSTRPSTDNPFYAFHDNLGFEQTQNSTGQPNSESTEQRPSADEFSSPPKFKSSLLNAEGKEDETKRLRIELSQTMEMYHAACKEALAAKQKVMELKQWKMREERRLRGACQTEETTTRTVETVKRKVKRNAGDASEDDEEARRRRRRSSSSSKATPEKVVGTEMQQRCRVKTGARAERKTEKENAINAYGESHKELEYRSLLHIVVVLSLFYFYFSIS